MKQFILTLVLLLFATIIPANAYGFSAKNDDGVTIYYYITSSSEKTCEVRYDSNYRSYSGTVVIPETVTDDGTTYTVTSIGSSAFESCTGLTSVIIPNSVTKIGSDAFYRCYGLTSITIPNSVTTIGDHAFYYCSSLKEVTIGDGVTSIGSFAFQDCTELTSVTIGNSVTSIDYYAFCCCTKLTEVTIPNSVTSIGNYAFMDCISLKTLTFEDGEEILTVSSSSDSFVSCPIETLYVGRNLSFSNSSRSTFQNKTTLTSLTIGDQVTDIPSNCFLDCTGLTKVTIGNSVTSIGSYAFKDCAGLTSVTIPNSVTSVGTYAFSDCTGLTEVIIGNSVTTIGSYAFYECTGLRGVAIGNSVTCIETRAFSGCTSLATLTIEDSDETLTIMTSKSSTPFDSCPIKTLYWGRNVSYTDEYSPFREKTSLTSLTISEYVNDISTYAFYGCLSLLGVVIPSSVTSIDTQAFSGCTSLAVLTLEDGEETLTLTTNSSDTPFADCPIETLYLGRNLSFSSNAYSPFKNDTTLTSLTISESVTEIAGYSFYGCSGLTEITIPNSVTSIGNYVFYNCSGLTSLTIGNSVTSIGSYAFYDCSSLTGTLNIPESVTTIGSWAFAHCSGLTGTLTIPNSVTVIDDRTFYDCFSLTEVTIPNSVKTIGKYAFQYCSNLTGTLTIPNSVTEMGNYAFADCSGLTEVTIPNSVSEICNYAFRGCAGLTEVTIPNSVTSIGERAFSGCTSLSALTFEDGEGSRLTLTTSSSDTPFTDCPIEIVYLGRNIEYSYTSSNKTYYNSPFKNSSTLTSLIIGSDVTKIGQEEFYGCAELEGTLTIPNNVTSINAQAFYNCSSLKALTIEDCKETLTLTTSESYTPFTNCPIDTLYLGRNLSFSSNAYSPFKNDTTLTSITISESVTEIAGYSFYGCSGLTEITIPNSVTSIGNYAFQDCTGLTEVIIGNSVTSIGSYAFYDCSSIAEIAIPVRVTSIGNYVFNGCTDLTTLTLEDGEETLTLTTSSSSTPFTDCPIETLYLGRDVSYSSSYSPFRNKTTLTTLIIGNSVTEISREEFYGCTGLMGVTIPNSVTSIGSQAFNQCTGLKTLTMEDGEETLTLTTNSSGTPFTSCPVATMYLGRNISFNSSYPPFEDSKKTLTSLTIGGQVTDIPDETFYSCTNLIDITSLPTTPPTIYASTFNNLVKAKVQKEALLAYAKAWDYVLVIYTEEGGTKYYPVPIIYEGDAVVAADGGANGSAAKKGETVSITPLSGSSQVNGMAIYRSEDIVPEINSNGYYTVEVSEYHLSNRIYASGIGTQHYFDITVPSAGQVLEELTVYNVPLVYGLKVTGDVNGTDIMTIRKMPYIELLDLSDANIVSGGDPYYDYYETDDGTVGKYFFVDMPNLKYVKLPNNTKSIEDYAFNGVTGLTGVSIPGTVTSMGQEVFQGCTNLASISFEDGEETLTMTTSSSATSFTDCPIASLYLGRNLKYTYKNSTYGSTYYNSPFKNKQKLTTLVISNSVTAIGDSEFYGCSGLEEVTFPSSLITIGDNAFYGCIRLTEVTIPNSVTSIGTESFAECTGLTSLILEDGEETLTMTTSKSDTPFTDCPITSLYLGRDVSYSNSSYTVFMNNTKLTSLTIGNSVTNIASYSFYGCKGLTEVTIGNSVTSIGSYAFSSCTGLTEVIFPESLVTINSYAFSGCTRLTKLLFPDSVTTIGIGAFEDCTRLTALTIGSGMESIGSLAFGGCSELAQIDTRAATPPDITSDTFDEVDKTECVLNVPTGSINAYWIHLYWGLFFHINEKDVGTMDPVGRVTANAEAEIVGYYTTDGKKISHPMRGMNIVRYSDGSVKKVLVK